MIDDKRLREANLFQHWHAGDGLGRLIDGLDRETLLKRTAEIFSVADYLLLFGCVTQILSETPYPMRVTDRYELLHVWCGMKETLDERVKTGGKPK